MNTEPVITLGPFTVQTVQMIVGALKQQPMIHVEQLVVEISNSANAQIAEFQAKQVQEQGRKPLHVI